MKYYLTYRRCRQTISFLMIASHPGQWIKMTSRRRIVHRYSSLVLVSREVAMFQSFPHTHIPAKISLLHAGHASKSDLFSCHCTIGKKELFRCSGTEKSVCNTCFLYPPLLSVFASAADLRWINNQILPRSDKYLRSSEYVHPTLQWELNCHFSAVWIEYYSITIIAALEMFRIHLHWHSQFLLSFSPNREYANPSRFPFLHPFHTPLLPQQRCDRLVHDGKGVRTIGSPSQSGTQPSLLSRATFRTERIVSSTYATTLPPPFSIEKNIAIPVPQNDILSYQTVQRLRVSIVLRPRAGKLRGFFQSRRCR